MAKSLEDTAFYRYHRLLALNEVGGDPAANALPIVQFHNLMQRRSKEWPLGLTATPGVTTTCYARHQTRRRRESALAGAG